MLRWAILLIVVAPTFFATQPVLGQERTRASYGYLVYYQRSDGKKFEDGSKFRFLGVTTKWSERTEWLELISSVHRYKALVKELQTARDYQEGIELIREQKKKRQEGQQQPPPTKVPSVSNTKWEGGRGYLTLRPNGQFIFNLNANTFFDAELGTWAQTGNTLTLTYNWGGRVERYTIDGKALLSASGVRVMTRLE
ncbi:MAG: hypothetical protein L0Y72_01530 [Gemmataceae bacterium]|nr:hypothetical protein [Gemmataceae bacterium]